MQSSPSQKTPRHTRVEVGIFERWTKTGRVFEFNFPDGTGGTDWQTVKTLAAARRGRARMLAAVERGEIVCRTNWKGAEVMEEWFAIKSPEAPQAHEGRLSACSRSCDLAALWP